MKNLKTLLTRQITSNDFLHAAYVRAKRIAGPKTLPQPDNTLYELLNDCQNAEAIAAYKSYAAKIEKLLPKLKPIQFQEAINTIGFLTAINPALKDLSSSKAIGGDIQDFFADMVSTRPYDLPEAYVFAMMDKVEKLGDAYALPAYCYLFSVFQTYSDVGEADRHAAFIETALRWFAARPISQERLALFARAYSGSFPSSNEWNLKTIVEIERGLLRQYYDFIHPHLAHDLPQRQTCGGKIKLGLLRHTAKGEIDFFRPLVTCLPQNKYEIHIALFDADGMEDLQHAYPHVLFHVLDQAIDKAVTTLRETGLDILINTSSLSGGFLHPVAALVNYRVAPLQISYCADINTSGSPEMDYFLIGTVLGADDLQDELVETVLPCDGLGFFVPPPVLGPQDRTAKRKALGIGKDDIVLASNAHMLKLTPDLLAAWIEILAQSQDTKLLLMPFSSDLVTGRFSRTLLAMLWRLCDRQGVTRGRIVLSNTRGRAGTLDDLQAADIYLDSFPYSGATSGAEALTAGLPIVTRTGQAMRARFLAGMLAEIGLGDVVANDTQAYIALALKLAKSPDLRRELSARVATALQTASFFDAGRIAAQLDVVLADVMENGSMSVRDLEKNAV